MRYLVALPVFNELNHIDAVLDQITAVANDVLVVDDGSTDGTTAKLAARRDIRLLKHIQNRGYGAALRTAFRYAHKHRYDLLVTIDADGQHDPCLIKTFVDACGDWDLVSGSRYLDTFADDSTAPADRRAINQTITSELNQLLGLKLTDAFCGFKAYRVAPLAKLDLTDDGYAMPLELWVQAAAHGWRIRELAVPRIYLDASRTFGGNLDDPSKRLAHYRQVIQASLERAERSAAQWACEACRGLAWAADGFASTCSH
jgi:dolichol-phosphate mannosyltransferase